MTTPIDTPLPLPAPIEEIVPARPAPSERLISGIDLLDYGAGGLLSHKIYLVRGGGGVGKTLLGLQYLTRGLELQEPGVLITDQKPANVIAQAHSIGFAIDESVRRGQLAILNPSNRYFQLVESPADVMAIVDELLDYVKTIGGRRLVIDPVYTLINTTYSAHFALSITQSLLNALEDLPVTTLLIAGDEQAPELNPILRQLEQNAFGVIDLSHDASTGGRLMRLSKLRYASNDSLSAHYRILNGRGLINYRGEGEQVVDVTKPWEESERTTRTVLLLGATPQTIRRVREALGDDYQLQAESDLRVGVERAKHDKPDLILITPSRSVSAVAAILDLARDAESSIAFLSPAANRNADKVLYLRAGADDFITEPFNPKELHARVDALVRRRGRRLNLRDQGIASLTPEEIASLMNARENRPQPKGPVIQTHGDQISFVPEFEERLQRNVETASKLGQPFALYWIKADQEDITLNRAIARLCRQEDIVCRNKNGEFIAILTGTDQNGVKGFETRLHEKLGNRFETIRHGYSVHIP
ncbi:MAG: hypothetical protein DMF58_06450 [Acidobacteria bacterium]|nr:MAG: hypothetical protein DMF58_06450 [Acidobacteriota bacterium]